MAGSVKKLLLVCLVLGCSAFAQNSLVNCIKWKDSSGATVGTYCRPFTIKAGTNITFSDDQLTRVLTINAGETQESIRFADQFAGNDAGEKIAAAIADLPSTGGTVDARALEGAQTSATNFLLNVATKPVTLVLGHCTLTTVPLTGASNLHIKGSGKYDSVLKLASGSNDSLLTFDSKLKWELSDLTLDGNRTNQSGTSHVINILNTSGSALKYQMSRLYVIQGHDDGIHIPSGVGGGQISDVVVYFNDGNGVTDGSTDNGWTNLDVGQSGLSGIVVTGANIKIANAKSWFSGRITPASGFGYDIRSSRNICSGCEAQDNQAHGFKVTGNDHILVGLSANANSQASSGTYDGIFLVDATSSFISGNADAFADLNTYQGYGVNFTGTTTNNSVSLTTKGNVTAPVGGTPEGNNVTVVDGSGATTAYVMGSNVRFGSSAAQTGTIGLPNNKSVSGRNSTNTADLALIKLRTDDGVEIGNGYIAAFSTTSQIPSVTLTGATPTVAAARVGIGTTTGFGAGAAGTAVTTTTKGAGTGPTTPQTIVNYLKINLGGTDYYIPLVQ